MAAPTPTYEPRRPSEGTLYQIVHEHFETFRVRAASFRDGEGLPRFVEQEFRDFLQCGWRARLTQTTNASALALGGVDAPHVRV